MVLVSTFTLANPCPMDSSSSNDYDVDALGAGLDNLGLTTKKTFSVQLPQGEPTLNLPPLSDVMVEQTSSKDRANKPRALVSLFLSMPLGN